MNCSVGSYSKSPVTSADCGLAYTLNRFSLGMSIALSVIAINTYIHMLLLSIICSISIFQSDHLSRNHEIKLSGDIANCRIETIECVYLWWVFCLFGCVRLSFWGCFEPNKHTHTHGTNKATSTSCVRCVSCVSNVWMVLTHIMFGRTPFQCFVCYFFCLFDFAQEKKKFSKPNLASHG